MKIKTKVTDNICIVTVKTDKNIANCLCNIKNELESRKIKMHYSSIINFLQNEKIVVIAIEENDLYPWLSAVSYIKESAGILSYTINCANTLICCEKCQDKIFDIIRRNEDKIRLIFETDHIECIICESEIKQKILSKIEAL